MFGKSKINFSKQQPHLLLEKDALQLLHKIVTNFNIKLHQKHFFYIITQNKRILKKLSSMYLISTTSLFLTAQQFST